MFRLIFECIEQGKSRRLAAERCFHRIPYENKIAVRILERNTEYFPMPIEDESDGKAVVTVDSEDERTE
jgi:hypothetical protein